MTRLRTTCLGGVAGVIVGLAGATAWRHATTRYLVDVSPPRVAPGDKGYSFTFDYLKYVSGPNWWPAIGILAAAGLTIGLLGGASYAFISQRLKSVAARAITATCTAVLAGTAIGSITYLYGQSTHPVVNIRAVIDPTYRGPSSASDSRIVPGAPWFFELSPAALYLPLLGALTGALAISISALYRKMLRRASPRTTPTPGSAADSKS